LERQSANALGPEQQLVQVPPTETTETGLLGELINRFQQATATTTSTAAKQKQVTDHNPNPGDTLTQSYTAEPSGFFGKILGTIQQPAAVKGSEENVPSPENTKSETSNNSTQPSNTGLLGGIIETIQHKAVGPSVQASKESIAVPAHESTLTGSIVNAAEREMDNLKTATTTTATTTAPEQPEIQERQPTLLQKVQNLPSSQQPFQGPAALMLETDRSATSALAPNNSVSPSSTIVLTETPTLHTDTLPAPPATQSPQAPMAKQHGHPNLGTGEAGAGAPNTLEPSRPVPPVAAVRNETTNEACQATLADQSRNDAPKKEPGSTAATSTLAPNTSNAQPSTKSKPVNTPTRQPVLVQQSLSTGKVLNENLTTETAPEKAPTSWRAIKIFVAVIVSLLCIGGILAIISHAITVNSVATDFL
jgi:hypothetical protein